MPHRILLISFALLATLILAVAQQNGDRKEQFRLRSLAAEKTGLAEPYKGIFTQAGPTAGLFPIKATGVSTEPVRKGTLAFLAALTAEQRAKTTFPIDDVEWRKWMNQDFYTRQGMGFGEMNPKQREAAMAMMRAGLSARGLKLTQEIMQLNYHLGELNKNDFDRYDETSYWITVMGDPAQKQQPWGWQLDGHHVIINYFVLGDQVVMSPVFLGSEPVTANSGKYKGISILQREQNDALALATSFTSDQKAKAILSSSKTKNNNLTEAFRDNVQLDYAGLKVSEFSAPQKLQLLDLITLYIGNMEDGHARVKMADIKKHLDETYFAWIGGTEPDSVFYYRIHSPVVLIEFDHQQPVGIRQLYPDSTKPIREHIHTVIRTPNGNDYGKDLLRQHYARHPH